MSVESFVFAAAAVAALAGAVGVVVSRNPVHAALSLVGTLFAIAVLFLNQGANLLAAVQVIVYTGAIVVLILFVLMLLGIDNDEDLQTEPLVGQRVLAAVMGLVLLGGLLLVIIAGGDQLVSGSHSVTQSLADGKSVTDIAQIGQQLFTTYVFPLEVTAALLTIAVVGAVVMARRLKDMQPVPEPGPLVPPDDPIISGVPEAAPEGEH